MEEKIEQIKKWLGTGSINMFGLPCSGKDTIGHSLANLLGAEFISSGELLRAAGEEVQNSGQLSPTNVFYDVVLPAFAKPTLGNKALILSSIGRWQGEEQRIIQATADNGHPIKSVLYIQIAEDEIYRRLDIADTVGDRAKRDDDQRSKVQTRIDEFHNKTLPVIDVYRNMGILVEINGQQSREEVFAEVVDKLYEFSKS